MREDAPEIRTLAQLQRKFEQVLDATEHGALEPKQIDGMNTTLKQIKALNIDLPLRIMSLVAKFGKGDSSTIPYPRATMVREFLGLSPQPKAQEAGKAFLMASDLEHRA